MSTLQSKGRQTVTAFFDDKSDAERAAERIRAEGVSSADIRIVAGSGAAGSSERPTEAKGFWESLGDLFMPDEDRYAYAEGLNRGGYLVSVTTADVNHERVLDILDDEGTVDMNEREESWRSEGWKGFEGNSEGYASQTYDRSTSGLAGVGGGGAGAPSGRDVLESGTGRSASSRDTAPRGTADLGASRLGSTSADVLGGDRLTGGSEALSQDHDGRIDVMEERLRVGKRDVSHGRVRVRSYIVEEPVQEQVDLHGEHVEIERHAVDRAVGAGDAVFADRTLELEETSEEAVVSKDARVKEEINLNRRGSDRTETISDTVRRTEVEIEDDRRNKSLSAEEVSRQTGRKF